MSKTWKTHTKRCSSFESDRRHRQYPCQVGRFRRRADRCPALRGAAASVDARRVAGGPQGREGRRRLDARRSGRRDGDGPPACGLPAGVHLADPRAGCQRLPYARDAGPRPAGRRRGRHGALPGAQRADRRLRHGRDDRPGDGRQHVPRRVHLAGDENPFPGAPRLHGLPAAVRPDR